MLESFAYWFVVVWLFLGAIATVYMVGKRRPVITGGTAVITVGLTVLLIAAITYVRSV